MNWMSRFPSPCGVWVVSIWLAILKQRSTKFPSPCGVWVVSGFTQIICGKPSFRPLAGCGLFPSEREIIAAILVSVPLRGVGCFSVNS